MNTQRNAFISTHASRLGLALALALGSLAGTPGAAQAAAP